MFELTVCNSAVTLPREALLHDVYPRQRIHELSQLPPNLGLAFKTPIRKKKKYIHSYIWSQ